MSLSRKEKIVIFAVILFVCVIVVGSGIYEKKQSEPKAKNRFFENPFSEVDPGIDQQSGNYANDALVVDGYVYFYKSRVKLGNYDKVDELEKCGNNVIYRLSPAHLSYHSFQASPGFYRNTHIHLQPARRLHNYRFAGQSLDQPLKMDSRKTGSSPV